MTDSRLRQDILAELEFEPAIEAAHIGVIVDKSVVVLTGHVASYAQKAAAVRAASRVRGVRAVADEIEVRHTATEKIVDDEIARRALAILDWDLAVPPGAVSLLVRDGFVTLTGQVNWQFERTSAEEDVRKLSGVRGVINQIEVRPKVQAADVKSKIEAALRRRAEVEAGDIQVSVTDGSNVCLEGKVETLEERIAVRNAAWSAPGVTAVEDHLKVA